MDCILPCVLFFTAKDILIVADKDSHIQTLHVDLREEFLRKGLSLVIYLSLSWYRKHWTKFQGKERIMFHMCFHREILKKNP